MQIDEECILILEGEPPAVVHIDPHLGRALGSAAKPGACVFDIVHPSDAAKARSALEAAGRGHRPPVRMRLRGAVRDLEVECTFHRAPGRVVMVVRGTCDRQRAADAERLAFERRLTIEHLRQVDRARSEMIGAAAHEMRTPLVPLALQLEMLRRGDLGDLTEEQRDVVDMLDRNVGRLQDLLESMLDVSRIGAGRFRVAPGPTDLAGVLRDVAAMFRGQARAAGIDLETSLPPHLPATADRRRIRQVAVNLISNALKYTPSGGRVVVRSVEAHDAVGFAVEDTGRGFSEGQAAGLFELYHRLHRSPSDPPGAGLGLYICRGIVEAHGGLIECASPGPGASFRVLLPVKPTDAGEGRAGS